MGIYAVVRVKGDQIRVEPGQKVLVPRLTAEVGEKLELEEVLAVGGEGEVRVGRPLVSGARVLAEVLAHPRGPKVHIFKFKRRKDYRRRAGHRTALTELLIAGVRAGEGA